jgi:NDP-sugar pyrophosphorylase family protein
LKAIVLVGGEGTRLRPLTETIPKPLLPLMNRPSLAGVLDHLAEYGVKEVILSSSYLESAFRPFIDARGDALPKIRWINEAAPLGTAGAIVNALPLLGDDAFFVLNGDILTDLDLSEMVRLHHDRRAYATIALTHVEDARPFGLVPTGDDGEVEEFREKPAELVPGEINAGTYVLEPEALSGWPAGENISIERQVFPALIDGGAPVFGFLSDAYWIDVGTPEKYLQAHFDLLEGRVAGRSYETPLVAPDAEVDTAARLGRRVVVGPGSRVESGAAVEDSVLHAGSVVERGATVECSVLGPGAHVAAGARIRGTVLAEGARVGEGASAEDERISAGMSFRARPETS